ncbi:hypothetical protein BCR36DRAFT_581885 [Piromyces finnis]|uniref:Uncharacterized protein n=1 Tax=Piromyces finnis TaxID=1754191 RepID=A0A1Y1VFB8_9FUNG|nr:hypothetical protein BCR36DRAFT_581885 [Piromyces finnis]|eukprot:ORX54260.1 hypothetical protein BCR36DRAFT_581885 [Piromyces finnis]
MFQQHNLYEDPNQYRSAPQAQSPQVQSPSQPANSYTIDIAPPSFALLPNAQQHMGQPAPTFNSFQSPLPSQQLSPLSPPSSYTTSSYAPSPSMVSPLPQNNYIYQPVNNGMPNLCGNMQQPSISMPQPQAGLGMNYTTPQVIDTTPRFSIPQPSNGMMSPSQMVSPYSPGFTSTYPGQPLMSPQSAQPNYAASTTSPQSQINYNQLNMY